MQTAGKWTASITNIAVGADKTTTKQECKGSSSSLFFITTTANFLFYDI
jgi:hypothetical protein